MSMDIELTEQQ